jgi:hypothetical protein
MKINKVLIRVLHFFGLCNDQQHLDDVSVRILDNKIFKKTYNTYEEIYLDWELDVDSSIENGYHDPSNFEKLTDKGISHIKKIVYSALEEDKRFKIRCNNVRTVYVIFPDHSAKPIRYIDDTLYWIGTDNEAYNRAIKLEKLLD